MPGHQKNPYRFFLKRSFPNCNFEPSSSSPRSDSKYHLRPNQNRNRDKNSMNLRSRTIAKKSNLPLTTLRNNTKQTMRKRATAMATKKAPKRKKPSARSLRMKDIVSLLCNWEEKMCMLAANAKNIGKKLPKAKIDVQKNWPPLRSISAPNILSTTTSTCPMEETTVPASNDMPQPSMQLKPLNIEQWEDMTRSWQTERNKLKLAETPASFQFSTPEAINTNDDEDTTKNFYFGPNCTL